jgi:adenylate cyclase
MKRHLCAILAGDIVGYSRLMEHDEAGTIARQRAHFDSVIRPKLETYEGRIVKLMGDGILIEFASVVDAVNYAVTIQRTILALESDVSPDLQIIYRMGINLGDVFYENDDILGDGVNIAARLEQMSDPGGICISGTVYDHLKSNIPVDYEPLGNVSVKNIQQPVRAYKIILDRQGHKPTQSRKWTPLIAAFGLIIAVVAGWWGWNLSTTGSAPTVDIRDHSDTLTDPIQADDKPSIAVLPFDNMNNDPDQDYFSDGMTEDLITDLSQVSGLFVLARNTTFVYKSQAVNVQQVGRELGVNYVLEGSVRRAGDQIRINAQLIDVKTGGHVWAERFDRDLTDVFELQDDVVQHIVSAMAVTLKTDEQARLSRTDKIDPEAYDALLRGLEKLRRFTPATMAEAREFFKKAIAIEPGFARAHADLALTYGTAAEQLWVEDYQSFALKAHESGLRALALDPDDARVHFVLSVVYRALGMPQKAVQAAQRAVELEPNYADGHTALTLALNFAGHPAEGLAAVKLATKLNPLKPFFYVHAEGHSQYLLGNYERAARLFEQVIESNPEFSASHKMLAATYIELDRLEDAAWAVSELLTVAPSFSLESELKIAPYADPEVARRYMKNLRKAGLE